MGQNEVYLGPKSNIVLLNVSYFGASVFLFLTETVIIVTLPLFQMVFICYFFAQLDMLSIFPTHPVCQKEQSEFWLNRLTQCFDLGVT